MLPTENTYNEMVRPWAIVTGTYACQTVAANNTNAPNSTLHARLCQSSPPVANDALVPCLMIHWQVFMLV